MHFFISEFTWEQVGNSSTSFEGCLALVEEPKMVYEDAKKACEGENSKLLEFWSEEEFKEVKYNCNINRVMRKNSCMLELSHPLSAH